MKQVKSFNPSKGGTKPYYCLQNVRLGFGIPPAYADAWTAWKNTEQHTGTPPSGLDVPIFFEFRATLDGVYKNWGHIAVRLKDGRVWTDGRYYPNIQSLVDNYLSNGKYVGWGESVNGVKVIKKGEEMFNGKTAHQWFSVALKYDKRIKELQSKTTQLSKAVKAKDTEITRLTKEVESLNAQVGTSEVSFRTALRVIVQAIKDSWR